MKTKRLGTQGLPKGVAAGDRYPASMMPFINR